MSLPKLWEEDRTWSTRWGGGWRGGPGEAWGARWWVMARAATSPGPRLRVKVDYWGNFEIRLPPLKPLSRLKLGWWEKVHSPEYCFKLLKGWRGSSRRVILPFPQFFLRPRSYLFWFRSKRRNRCFGLSLSSLVSTTRGQYKRFSFSLITLPVERNKTWYGRDKFTREKLHRHKIFALSNKYWSGQTFKIVKTFNPMENVNKNQANQEYNRAHFV